MSPPRWHAKPRPDRPTQVRPRSGRAVKPRRLPIRSGQPLTGVGRLPNLAGGPADPAKREILSAICETWLEDAHARDIVAAAAIEPEPDASPAAAKDGGTDPGTAAL